MADPGLKTWKDSYVRLPEVLKLLVARPRQGWPQPIRPYGDRVGIKGTLAADFKPSCDAHAGTLLIGNLLIGRRCKRFTPVGLLTIQSSCVAVRREALAWSK
jgi:hypothetical protein